MDVIQAYRVDQMIRDLRQSAVDGIVVLVTAVNRRAGSVTLFDGTALDGRPCLFAADPRAAEDLADALDAHNGPVFCTVEGWQLLG